MKTIAMIPRFGLAVALVILLGAEARAQLSQVFLYTGTLNTVTLDPGTYDITTYGAQGGFSTFLGRPGGLGAQMEAVFSFTAPTTLSILVGGAGGDGPGSPRGPGGGGGGTFVVNGLTPLIVAGGGGGGDRGGPGGNGLTTNDGNGGLGGAGGGAAGGGGFSTDGGPGFWGSGQGYSYLNGGGSAGGGFYGAGWGGYGGGGGGSNFNGGGGGGYTGGFGGGGPGGSYIDPSALARILELSGVASPDGSHNGMVTITPIPEPSTYALLLSGLASLLGVFIHRMRANNLTA